MKTHNSNSEVNFNQSSNFFGNRNKGSFFSKEGINTNTINKTQNTIQRFKINQRRDHSPGNLQELSVNKNSVIQDNFGIEAQSSKPFFNRTVTSLQKKCTECEKEEKIQRRTEEKDERKGVQAKPIFESETENQVSPNRNGEASIENKLANAKGNGSPLSHETNHEMSHSLGRDFSDVKVHNDSGANQLSRELNAQAFTHGNDIYFNSGKYEPNTKEGKHLLAHELTHVVQQSGTNPSQINRSVADNSRCSQTVDANAPPEPTIFLILADMMANSLLDSARLRIQLDLMTQTGVPAGDAFNAYRRRFGDPLAVGTRFRNRFNNSMHATIAEAQASEMQSLSGILDRISSTLSSDITYTCIGPHVRTFGNCIADCVNTGFDLITCAGPRIVICPAFWNLTSQQQGIGIIHEAVHIRFGFGDHDTAPFAHSFGQRRTEPECYASFVADVNGVTPFDPSCPPV